MNIIVAIIVSSRVVLPLVHVLFYEALHKGVLSGMEKEHTTVTNDLELCTIECT